MCREIRHFYLLNKWNGQETNYRSSSLRIWAREVRHERWGNDSVDRWPEFRSPEKHPQPQSSAGRDGGQRQKDPRSLLPSELLSSGFSERRGLTGNLRWRVGREEAQADGEPPHLHISTLSPLLYTPPQNTINMTCTHFGFCEGTEVHNQQNTGNDVFRTESSGKWNFSFSRKNKGGFLKI